MREKPEVMSEWDCINLAPLSNRLNVCIEYDLVFCWLPVGWIIYRNGGRRETCSHVLLELVDVLSLLSSLCSEMECHKRSSWKKKAWNSSQLAEVEKKESPTDSVGGREMFISFNQHSLFAFLNVACFEFWDCGLFMQRSLFTLFSFLETFECRFFSFKSWRCKRKCYYSPVGKSFLLYHLSIWDITP